MNDPKEVSKTWRFARRIPNTSTYVCIFCEKHLPNALGKVRVINNHLNSRPECKRKRSLTEAAERTRPNAENLQEAPPRSSPTQHLPRQLSLEQEATMQQQLIQQNEEHGAKFQGWIPQQIKDEQQLQFMGPAAYSPPGGTGEEQGASQPQFLPLHDVKQELENDDANESSTKLSKKLVLMWTELPE